MLALLIPLLWAAAGCGPTRRSPAAAPAQVNYRHQGQKVYFSYQDPRGDDRGAGHYQYPLRFDNREGFFDMVSFRVIDGGSMILFEITTRRPIQKFRPDGSSEAKGWFLQLMDIYIDKDGEPGSGEAGALPGRNVVFEEDSRWEQMVLLTPNRSEDVKRLIENRTQDLRLVELRKKIYIPLVVYVQGFKFVAQVPKAILGEPQPHWGYQVLMMPFEERNLDEGQFQNGKVFKFPRDDAFGGGTDYIGNPNVIDMLAPTAREQYGQLKRYFASPVPSDNRFAAIRMVRGPAATVPARPARPAHPARAVPLRREAPAPPAPAPPRFQPRGRSRHAPGTASGHGFQGLRPLSLEDPFLQNPPGSR